MPVRERPLSHEKAFFGRIRKNNFFAKIKKVVIAVAAKFSAWNLLCEKYFPSIDSERWIQIQNLVWCVIDTTRDRVLWHKDPRTTHHQSLSLYLGH